MADIEERLLSNSNVFEGLLSLVPENNEPQLKRKQTKEETKRAKKAKTDSGSAENALLKAKGSQNTEAAPPTQAAASRGKKDIMKQKQKQKQTQKQGESEDSNSVAEGGGVWGLAKTGMSSEKAKASQIEINGKTHGNQKAPQASPSSKTDIPTANAQDSESDTGVPADSGESTPVSQSTTLTAPEISDPPRKLQKAEIDPAIRAERRALLAARIEALRAKRMAADGSSAKNRQELIEARRKKEMARKERKKQLRLQAKAAEEAKRKEEAQPAGQTASGAAKDAPKSPAKQRPVNNFSFGAVTFDDGEQLDHTLRDFKKSRKRKGPTDILGQLKHIEAKKARIQNMPLEKQEKIQEKELWSKAFKQTVGERVRDDERLLKKSLKRQEQIKKKSEREWNERADTVSKAKAAKQKKREDNLAARREQKKLGKAGKKPKSTGGKKKKKGPARPGFEGTMKSTKSSFSGAKKGRK